MLRQPSTHLEHGFFRTHQLCEACGPTHKPPCTAHAWLTLPHASLPTLACPSPQTLDNNCCHFVNQVLLGAGSAGVDSYFPEYSMPSWEPRD